MKEHRLFKKVLEEQAQMFEQIGVDVEESIYADLTNSIYDYERYHADSSLEMARLTARANIELLKRKWLKEHANKPKGK